ncbi:MAG: hypothetical protein WC966_05635 [Bradymonadales bacterium]|jgi:hypothetical protein
MKKMFLLIAALMILPSCIEIVKVIFTKNKPAIAADTEGSKVKTPSRSISGNELFDPLLQSWNEARNARDAKALAKLFAPQCYTHGKSMTNNELIDYYTEAFAKHEDYSQTITAEPVFYEITPDLWSIQVRKDFTQSGKTVNTEVLLIVERIDEVWLIVNESDDSLDRNILKKVGIESITRKAKNCDEIVHQILTTAPYFRFIIMQQWEVARKNKVKLKLLMQKEERGYFFQLVEQHREENRELVQTRFFFNPRAHELTQHDVVLDTHNVIPYDKSVNEELDLLCKSEYPIVRLI